MAVVGNTRETIALLSWFLCRAFFPSVYPARIKSRAGHEKGLSNGTASNRDLLSDGHVLSEISSALASRILDWDRRCASIRLERCRKHRRTTTDGT